MCGWIELAALHSIWVCAVNEPEHMSNRSVQLFSNYKSIDFQKFFDFIDNTQNFSDSSEVLFAFKLSLAINPNKIELKTNSFPQIIKY